MIVRNFDTAQHVLIVAEIGNNHEGRFETAQELVRQASACGADAVKFQTFRTEHYVSAANAARFARLKSFEFTPAQFEALATLAHSLQLLFISTPFDLASARLLEPLVDAFKIASGDNTFYPLIDWVAQTGKPLIISTGASDAVQVERAVAAVRRRWTATSLSQLAILHCVSSYPVEPAQANLRSIPFLAERCPDVTVGYSDHVAGIEASVLAAGLGARVIEKHFTLDHRLSDFRDHQLSADPGELRELVRRVRLAESLRGEHAKRVQPCETPAVTELRRSIVAGADLPKGHRLQPSDVTWVRPAGGLAPGQEAQLVGKSLCRDVRFGELVQPSDVA